MRSATQTGFPVFGGARGREISKSLLDIRSSFQKNIQVLQGLDYDILDVKSTLWHDDYSVFKKGLKELEVMLQNVIQMAFQSMRSVNEGVELLEAFTLLAKRENIKRTVHRMTSDVFQLFLEVRSFLCVCLSCFVVALITAVAQDMAVVKKEFDVHKRSPPLMPFYPVFSGAAMWAQSLLDRVSHQWVRFSPRPVNPHSH